MRYIDGAVTHKLPWSIIKSIEKLAKSIIPEISFMFRPQWKYNYSVVTDDLKERYRDDLREFEDITDVPVEEVLSDLKGPFHIISFPSIERKNILLHCLTGHELGHLIIRKYIDKTLIDNFTKKIQPEVHEIIMGNYLSHFGSLNMFTSLYAKQDIKNNISLVMQIWRRGLEEILSDIIGVLIFGPAMLFSMYELSLQKKLDHKPGYTNNFYPSWRYRLREIVKVLQRPSGRFFPLPVKKFSSDEIIRNVNGSFELIKQLTEEKFDLDIIKEDKLLKIAYREVENDVVEICRANDFFKVELKGKIVTPNSLYKDIEHLIIRLKHGLPPNAVEHSLDTRRPATMVEIINAAWFFKLSFHQELLNKHGGIDDEVFKKKDTLNRLTLKSIEYSDIESEYRSKVRIDGKKGNIK